LTGRYHKTGGPHGNAGTSPGATDRSHSAGSADLSAAQRFYTAIFESLNIAIGGTGDDYFWADELFVSTRDSKAAQGALTGRHHLAFQAQSPRMVDSFYKAAMANGGKDNGAPGERAYLPGYYAAFVLDPDGNNIEAVYHGEAKRSAPSVQITF
jgi:catechol 2,3-dioxygenase-like lactoylglutathione lyase family enzyme